MVPTDTYIVEYILVLLHWVRQPWKFKKLKRKCSQIKIILGQQFQELLFDRLLVDSIGITFYNNARDISRNRPTARVFLYQNKCVFGVWEEPAVAYNRLGHVILDRALPTSFGYCH